MILTRRHFLGGALATGAGVAVSSCVGGPPIAALPAPVPTPIATPTAVAAATPAPVIEGPPLLLEALAALDRNAPYLTHTDKIGLVDFSLHSREPRFNLVDTATGQIERTWLVAHGSGSDPDASGMLQRFSNEMGSNATSRGAYLTSEVYYGKYGRSQRLIGMDADNNMALDRAIVVHGAPYVDPSLIASQGRIGRSQGCFAFELNEVANVMDLLGQGRMIYAGKLA